MIEFPVDTARALTNALALLRDSTGRPPQLAPADPGGHRPRPHPVRYRLAGRAERTVVHNIANLSAFEGFTDADRDGVDREIAARLFPRLA